MRLLLATHILLRALANDLRLHGRMRGWIEELATIVLFSAANIWEIAIKATLHHTRFGVRPPAIADAARATGFTERPVHDAAMVA